MSFPLFAAFNNIVLLLLCFWASAQNSSKLKAGIYAGIFTLVLALGFDAIPAVPDWILLSNVQVSESSALIDIELSIQKLLLGVALCFCLPSLVSSSRSFHYQNAAISFLGAVIFVTTCAVVMDLKWQVNNLSALPYFLVTNTVVAFAEELFFRGFILGALLWFLPNKTLYRMVALVISALVFGVAHVAGGEWFVLVAIVAGLLYGAVYLLSGSLVWPIVCHALVNIIHFVFLPYPLFSP